MPSLMEPALPNGVLRGQTQPRLQLGADVALRPWRSGDVGMVMAAFGEPDIQLWHMKRMDSEQEAEQWIASWAEAWQSEKDASWAIARTDTDEAIGCAALRSLSHWSAAAQVSYWSSLRREGKA